MVTDFGVFTGTDEEGDEIDAGIDFGSKRKRKNMIIDPTKIMSVGGSTPKRGSGGEMDWTNSPSNNNTPAQRLSPEQKKQEAEQKKKDFWNEKVASRLDALLETYPLQTDFVIWTYSVLTGHENLTREKREDLIKYSDQKLKNTYEQYSALLKHLDKNGLEGTKKKWFKNNIVDVTGDSYQDVYGLKFGDIKIKISTSKTLKRTTKYNDEYGLHQRLVSILPDLKIIPIEQVKSFIETHKHKVEQRKAMDAVQTQAIRENQRRHNAEVKERAEAAEAVRKAEEAKEMALHLDHGSVESVLDIPVPSFQKDTIQEEVAAIDPLAYDGLSNYGMEMNVEVTAVVNWLSHHFLEQAKKPRNLISHVDAVIEEVDAYKKQSALENDPGTIEKFFAKFASSDIQIVPDEEMPLARVKKLSMDMPQIAAQDAIKLSKELKAIEHLQSVIEGYYEIIEGYREVLVAEKPALEARALKREGLVADVKRTNVAASIESTLSRLDQNLAFMRVFVGNFHQLALRTQEAHRQLPSTAALAATLQLPLMDAIQTFRAHELRRNQLLGREVTEAVAKRVGVSPAKVEALEDFNVTRTQDLMTESLNRMVKQLEKVPVRVEERLSERTEVAKKMQEILMDGASNDHAEPEKKAERTRANHPSFNRGGGGGFTSM